MRSITLPTDRADEKYYRASKVIKSYQRSAVLKTRPFHVQYWGRHQSCRKVQSERKTWRKERWKLIRKFPRKEEDKSSRCSLSKTTEHGVSALKPKTIQPEDIKSRNSDEQLLRWQLQRAFRKMLIVQQRQDLISPSHNFKVKCLPQEANVLQHGA